MSELCRENSLVYACNQHGGRAVASCVDGEWSNCACVAAPAKTPGSASSLCGNGEIDDGELCDGESMGDATCAAWSGTGSDGTLKCNDGCGLDTSDCSAVSPSEATCGNGELETGEYCDGKASPPGIDCTIFQGHGAYGTVLCNQKCQFDSIMCRIP